MWASIATMLQTCKMNGVDPYARAQQTLERIADRWPNKNIEAFMPWDFKSERYRVYAYADGQIWSRLDGKPSPGAILAARGAEVVAVGHG